MQVKELVRRSAAPGWGHPGGGRTLAAPVAAHCGKLHPMGRCRARYLALGLFALSACIVNLTFNMRRSLPLQTQPGATAVSQNVLLDLSQYTEITEHKAQIRSLDLDYAEVTVGKINNANAATRITGTLKLRRSLIGAPEVVVGTVDLAIVNGTTKRLNGTPELDAFLLQQLHEQGTFYALLDGASDGAADFVLDVDLHASIAYDAGLF
jgi:hypothetical protein